MSFRLSRAASLLLASAAWAALPARADDTFTTTRFGITFSDGWQAMPTLAAGDSGLALMYAYSMMGYCYMAAASADHPVPAGELDAYRQQYAGGDSAVKAGEGTSALGGKDFGYVEYRSADTSNGDTRIRLYSTTQGGIRFDAVFIYDHNAADILVPEMEAALATLDLSATPIRARAPRGPLAWRPADHDVLGRARPVAAPAILYRLPPIR